MGRVTTAGAVLVAAVTLLPGPASAAGPGPRAAADGPACGGRAATIVGTASDDVLVGTSGTDVIVARGGDDLVLGRGEPDLVCAGAGDDVVRRAGFAVGGSGDDRLHGLRDEGALLVGGPGDDVIVGSSGFDWIYGSSDDQLGYGGPEVPVRSDDDLIRTAGGVDRVFVAAGNDEVHAGSGDDVVEVSSTVAGLDLAVGSGDDEVDAVVPAVARLGFRGGAGLDQLTATFVVPDGVRLPGTADLASGVFSAGGPPGRFGGWEGLWLSGAVDWSVVGTDGDDDVFVGEGTVQATMGDGNDLVQTTNRLDDFVDGGPGRLDGAWLGEGEGDRCVDVEAGSCVED